MANGMARMAQVQEPALPVLFPLQVQGLCFVVGSRRLLDGVTFRTASPTRTIILGPNGAGKSLLLRCCHGLLQPSAGRITWGQCDVTTARQYHAMVFQRPVLLRRSVAANLRYVLSLRGVPRRQRPALVTEALAHAGLGPQATQAARLLSGGEQQRLALARAWLLQPQVIFLDEPTASLDPAATHAVETFLAQLHQRGMHIMMATHDLGQARRLADDVLFLHHGRLLEYTPAPQFFTRPQSKEAAAFLDGTLLW